VSDEAYNAGIAQAQRAYRRLPSNLNTIELIKTFANMRLALFRSFKTWPTFGAGWARRIGGVEAESLRMAMTSTGTPPTAQDAAICEHAKSVKTLAAAHRGSAVKASAGAVAAGAAHQAANGPPSALYLILAIFIVGVGGLLVRASLQKQRALGLVAAIKGATP
jgi:lysozyme family protein